MLLIFGDRDQIAPRAHGQRLMKASDEPPMSGCVDHTFAYRDASDESVTCVMPFLINALQSVALPRNRRPNPPFHPTAFSGW